MKLVLDKKHRNLLTGFSKYNKFGGTKHVICKVCVHKRDCDPNLNFMILPCNRWRSDYYNRYMACNLWRMNII